MGDYKREAISTWLRFHVIQRDGFECRYCGEILQRSDLHIDHVRPVSKGGTNSVFNLVVSCAACNLSSGNRVKNSEVVMIQTELYCKELRQLAGDTTKEISNEQKNIIASVIGVFEEKYWCKAAEYAFLSSGDIEDRIYTTKGISIFLCNGGKIS